MKLAIMTKSTFFVEEDKILILVVRRGHGQPASFQARFITHVLRATAHFLARRLSSQDYSSRSLLPQAGIRFGGNTYRRSSLHLYQMDTRASTVAPVQISVMLKEMKKKSNYVFLKNIFDCIEFKDEKSSFSMQQLEMAAKGWTH